MIDVYQLTKTFSETERFGLSSQMQRAATSIAANIAEGAARGGKIEFGRYLNIALGSLAELDTQLEISYELRYLDESLFHSLVTKIQKVGKLITGLRRSLQRS